MRQIPLGARGTSTLRVQPEHLANRFKDAILPHEVFRAHNVKRIGYDPWNRDFFKPSLLRARFTETVIAERFEAWSLGSRQSCAVDVRLAHDCQNGCKWQSCTRQAESDAQKRRHGRFDHESRDDAGGAGQQAV